MKAMHVERDLQRGSLSLDLEQVVELCVLLSQAEYGDYNQNLTKYLYTQICGQKSDLSTMNRYSSCRTNHTINDCIC